MARRKRSGSGRPDKTQLPKSNDNVKSEVEGNNSTPPDTKEGTNTSSVPSSNDPEWYGRDTQLLSDAANIPFSLPLGDPLKLYGEAQSDIVPTTTTAVLKWSSVSNLYAQAVPGICTLKLKPTYGQNLVKTDPLNVCANAFYTHVRYVNSGRKNYDPADLMVYALAFADIYSFTLWVQRLYSYAFMYSQKNKYIAKALIEANGINAEDITTNLANFRYWINAWINKVSSFALPADIYFFKRRAFLYANYYIENGFGNIKDQLYQFAPAAFMKYGLDSDGKGCLAMKDLNFSTPWKLADIIACANDLMDNITGDEDFGLMSGDVLKAYGANIISLAPMPSEAMLLPVHDPYVLSQFKNAKIVSIDTTKTYTYDTNTWANGFLMQTANGLLVSRYFMRVAQPNSDANAYAAARETVNLTMPALLSVENPAPNEGDVVEGTRLTPCWTGDPIDDGASSHDVFYNCGTEVCVAAVMSTFRYNGSTVLIHDQHVWTHNIDGVVVTANGAAGPISETTSFLAELTGFKYAPICYSMTIHNSSGYYTVERIQPMSNLDNYTVLSKTELSKLHECALLSLFYVPGVAKMVNNL